MGGEGLHSWSGNSIAGDRKRAPDKKDPIPAKHQMGLWLGSRRSGRSFPGTTTPANGARGSISARDVRRHGLHILIRVFSSPRIADAESCDPKGRRPTRQLGPRFASAICFAGHPIQRRGPDLTCTRRQAPPTDQSKLGGGKVSDQGSIYIGNHGVLLYPYPFF